MGEKKCPFIRECFWSVECTQVLAFCSVESLRSILLLYLSMDVYEIWQPCGKYEALEIDRTEFSSIRFRGLYGGKIFSPGIQTLSAAVRCLDPGQEIFRYYQLPIDYIHTDLQRFRTCLSGFVPIHRNMVKNKRK